MIPEIKTRDAVKGTIKTLDKAAVAGERMKQAYIRTKDKAEQSVSVAESNPEEYAAGRISGSADTLTYEAAHQFDRLGREAVKATKDNISTVRERMEQRRSDPPKRAAHKQAEKQAKQRAAEAVHTTQTPVSSPVSTPSASDTATRPQIKIVERSDGSIRQAAKSTGSITVNVGKGTIKTAPRSIKTAGRTADATIKTSQAVSAAQKSALAATKTSQRTAQAARAAAKRTAEATKATAKATVSAVKGIIAACIIHKNSQSDRKKVLTGGNYRKL